MSFDPSTIAAWWGAIIATGVFIWDFVKWKMGGPVPVIHANGGMVLAGVGKPDDHRVIHIRVANRGDQPTTISSFGMFFYRDEKQRKRKSSDRSFVVVPTTVQPIPYLLHPGAVWQGYFDQTNDLNEMAHEGILELQTYFSHSDNGVAVDIQFHEVANASDGDD